MKSWLAEYRYVATYVLGLSLLRGIVLPDFRYEAISVIGIQLVYPIMLLLPLARSRGLTSSYWLYASLGVVGITLSHAVGTARYIHWAGVESYDAVSRAVGTLSLIAMLAFFLVVYTMVWLFLNRRSH